MEFPQYPQNSRRYESFRFYRRIINDRMEKCKNGRQVVNCVFAASIFEVQKVRQYYYHGSNVGQTGIAQ